MTELHSPLALPIHGALWTRPAGSLDYKLTQRFGCTGVTAEPPLGPCAHYHRGIDLGNGHAGGAVLAAKAGTVTYAGLIDVPTAPGGHQSLVTITHGGGEYTFYIHLTIGIAKLAKVIAGQKIGLVGSVGTTAAHLHFAHKIGVSTSRAALPDGNGSFTDPWALIPHL